MNGSLHFNLNKINSGRTVFVLPALVLPAAKIVHFFLALVSGQFPDFR
jgi:hypothetical protein